MTSPYVTHDDLKDLPDELLKQINIKKNMLDDFKIMSILIDKQLDINKILVLYYQKYNVILERQWLMCKLYRMKQKGLVKTVGNKKGIYEIPSEVQDEY